MRVVVTGGRDYADAATVYATLDAVKPTIIAQGEAHGADGLARAWAYERGVPCVGYRADWSWGKRGGPQRNAKMLREFGPDLVVAFPGGNGTADCVRRALRLGIPVREVAP